MGLERSRGSVCRLYSSWTPCSGEKTGIVSAEVEKKRSGVKELEEAESDEEGKDSAGVCTRDQKSRAEQMMNLRGELFVSFALVRGHHALNASTT